MNSEDHFNTASETTSQRYLWAVGLDPETFPPGTFLPGNRYQVIAAQIVQDTQPFKMPEITDEVPSYVISYLKLSRLPLNLPRPYGILRWGEELEISEVLLLDHEPLSESGQLFATLEMSWAEAPVLRQINWLWQVLQLWQPLQEQHMTLTLLQQQFLRVDGPWVRVVELQADVTQVELTQLGDLWIQWLPGAKPEIEESLAEFFYSLSRGISRYQCRITKLDQIALKHFQTAVPLTIRISSATDKGPRRDHNEDTCYPDPNHQQRAQQSEYLRDRLAIICDGLGGHEGGEIASSMAIKTFEQQLQVLLRQVETDPDPFSPETFTAQLEAITRIVNDLIVARNDQQQRQAQQRMGTTLVLAVAPRPHGKPSNEIYVLNVGDSRAYWITPQSCRQVTLDDDVATRETTLGYNFYAYSAQRIDGGALIQALGTRPSNVLLPRVQRFSIDEDCLLLLCSDGLSDYDRVEEIWQSHLRSVLVENIPLDQACQDLIEQANTLNGHDNSTVVLMRCRLAPLDPTEPDLESAVEVLESSQTVLQIAAADDVESIASTIMLNAEIAEQTKAKLIAAAPIQEDLPPTKTVAPSSKSSSKSNAKPQAQSTQTGRGFLVTLIAVMFLLGCSIAATQIPPVRHWLKQNIPGFPK